MNPLITKVITCYNLLRIRGMSHQVICQSWPSHMTVNDWISLLRVNLQQTVFRSTPNNKYVRFLRTGLWCLGIPFLMTYPPVNCPITMDITMLLMGKSTISMAIFNSKLWVYQRVNRSKRSWRNVLERIRSLHWPDSAHVGRWVGYNHEENGDSCAGKMEV